MNTNTPEYKVSEKLSNFAIYFSSLFSNIELGNDGDVKANRRRVGTWLVTTWKLVGAGCSLFSRCSGDTDVTGLPAVCFVVLSAALTLLFRESHVTCCQLHHTPSEILLHALTPQGAGFRKMGESPAASPKNKGPNRFCFINIFSKPGNLERLMATSY